MLRTLGTSLKPYVRLAALLDSSRYTPNQIVERLTRVSPPVANLTTPPDPQALVDDLLCLRLLQPLKAGGLYRRWPYLDGAIESQMLRYVALTLLVPLGNGNYELPILRAPLDGDPHPVAAWPYQEQLLACYEEAGLVRTDGHGSWYALPDALKPLLADNDCARALNKFLTYLKQVRTTSATLPPIDTDTLPILSRPLLEERIAEIQRELLIDRGTILRIYRALIAGHHVILSGPPGTGKTHLATLLPRVLWRDAKPLLQLTMSSDPQLAPIEPPRERPIYRDGYLAEVVTATEEWGVRHVIGGITPQVIREDGRSMLVYQVRHGFLTRALLSNYAGYDGVTPPTTFRRQELFAGDTRYRGCWLVIDEFTRAPIDAAFGSLLTTLGGQRNSHLAIPTDDGDLHVPMPRDFRIIGTLNSFDRHFLNQISEAMKRRFTFIDILPPRRQHAEAERGTVIMRALQRLQEQQVLEPGGDLPEGRIMWRGVLTISRTEARGDTEPGYRLVWSDQGGEQAFNCFWRIFSAIRVYRQLGTAQAEAVCRALFSGYLIGMDWAEALDSSLADTLADQLQVLTRDELRILLAYLDYAGDPGQFVDQVRRIVKGLPAVRQMAHLAQLRSIDDRSEGDPIDVVEADKLTLSQLERVFALHVPLLVTGRGLFAQRLHAFVSERGL